MRSEPEIRRALPELSFLFDVSRILDSSLDLREVAGPVLKSMADHMDLIHGTLTLFDRHSGEIVIEAGHGLTESQRKRGIYKPGEGIIGRVFQTGRPIRVPRLSEEPLFLNRTGRLEPPHLKDSSFVCVPIKLGKEVVGTLSAVRTYKGEVSLEDESRLLSILSSMISQAVKLRRQALEENRLLLEENQRLQKALKERYRPSNIVGNSNEIREVYNAIAQVSAGNTTVLITGESGTGKELVAGAIHYNSLRAGKPFVKVSCAALPESILESELFGHEKGAFTGAVAARKGRFELAHGGTLFLDEIGEASHAIQIKLLRVLQEREFERVGGMETVRTDVRIMAATNRDLKEAVDQGKFRADLFFRLNVFPIRLPPLRERKTDILLLADHFIEKYNKSHRKNIRRVSTPAIDMLMSYHWPGNVRELENCIERAVILSEDEVIHGHHLPPTLQTAEASNTRYSGALPATLENMEREMIIEALQTTRGNRAKAAQLLGISERIMGLRAHKHAVDYRKYRTKK